jgi:adenine-specific DNA-methyltransferase
MGVGSSLIAAVKQGRRTVGIDRDTDYCRLAKERLTALANGTLKIRPLGKPVHKPTGREKVAQIPLQWQDDEEKAE